MLKLDETIAEIKRAVDIVSIIGEYRPVHSEGSKYKTLCPFHDDHKPSMVIDPKFQNFKCWACSAQGDVFTFVQEMEKISFVEAKERLAERAGISLKRGSSDRKDSRQSLYQVLSWAQKVFENSLFTERTGAEARQYLRDRGLTEETARTYGIGFAPPAYEWLIQQAKREGWDFGSLLKSGLVKTREQGSPYDTFRGRLIFPIRDERGRVLGFGGRILPAFAKENSPKYLNSPASDVYNKSEVLYGIEVAAEVLKKRPAKDEVPAVPVVMEGYTDCLMAWQAGLKTAVATCGTALTPLHVKKLKQFTGYCGGRTVLMFDGDEAGQKAANESTRLFLSSELDLRLCVLPNGLDPCDFVKEQGIGALNERIEQAPDALHYLFQRARNKAAGGSIEEERRALEEVLEHLSTIPLMTGSAQQAMLNLTIHRVAMEFGQKEEGLRKRIEELRAARQADAGRRTFDRGEDLPNSTSVQGLEPTPGSDTTPMDAPLDPRERQVVQALVAFPGRAGEFRELFPVREIQHAGLRRITEACYELYEDLGNEASVDAIRERLDDRILDEIVMGLLESPKTWENPEDVLEGIKRWLRERSQRLTRKPVPVAAGAGDDSQELEKLRRMLGNAS